MLAHPVVQWHGRCAFMCESKQGVVCHFAEEGVWEQWENGREQFGLEADVWLLGQLMTGLDGHLGNQARESSLTSPFPGAACR